MSTPTPKYPNLAAALVAAQADARAVPKDARNSYHEYQYASAEAVLDEGRVALTNAGLALLSAGRSFVRADGEGSRGASIGRVVIKYRLVHEGGEALEFESSTAVIPDKGRPADKAEAAAVTSDLAYTLRGLLLLPRGLGDRAIDARDDRDYEPRDSRDRDDDRPRRPEPANDRAPDSDRQRREDPPRPAPVDTRPEHGRAADLAVEAQVGPHVAPIGPASNANAADPAQQALALDLMRQANVRPEKGGNGQWPDAADLFDQWRAAKLPPDLRIKPLRAILLLAFQSANDTEAVRGWHGIVAKLGLPDDVRTDVLIECFIAACDVARDADEFESWQHDMQDSRIKNPRLVDAFRKAADRTGWKPGKRAA